MQQLAFKFGPFSIHWYGILVALGFLAGLWSASRRAPAAGLDPERVFDIGPWLILGGILGARLMFVISYWDKEFAGKPFSEVFMIQRGGLVFYGGLIGGIVLGLGYILLRNLPLWKMADVLAPGIALGYVFGRFGCLMNGCCYGRPCDLPWAIRFPEGHGPPTQPVHPTQIYEALLNAVLYGVLVWLFKRRKFDGQVFAAYLIGYALLRSVVETFRGDYPPSYYLGGFLTPAHQVSIGILATGIVLWLMLSRASNRRPPADA